MSTGRVLWLIWCLMWAAVWTIAAVGTLGLTLIPAALSVAAFWLPVGKPGPAPMVQNNYPPPAQLPPPLPPSYREPF
jgi:hypothetical protein